MGSVNSALKRLPPSNSYVGGPGITLGGTLLLGSSFALSILWCLPAWPAFISNLRSDIAALFLGPSLLPCSPHLILGLHLLFTVFYHPNSAVKNFVSVPKTFPWSSPLFASAFSPNTTCAQSILLSFFYPTLK